MVTHRDPSLLALRAFEAAARRLSFTEAARELCVSQAAISRHVRALEAGFERPLFRRLHRRVELTTQGTRLASELEVGFAQIQQSSDSAVLGYRLLHDDDGTLWRQWFAAAAFGHYAYVANLGDGTTPGTVSEYAIGTGGALTLIGTITAGPSTFGIATTY
jgi:hypothetical protein